MIDHATRYVSFVVNSKKKEVVKKLFQYWIGISVIPIKF